MPFTVTMPKLSPTMEDGTIVKWYKKEGDFVAAGDVIIDVATDKATVEYEALDEGYLRKVLVPEDAAARVNQAIAIFSKDKSENIDAYKPEGILTKESGEKKEMAHATPVDEAAPKQQATTGMSQPQFAPEAPLADYEFEAPRDGAPDRIKASPLARRLAKEKGIDISTIKGTGPGSRIVSDDLNLGQPDLAVTFGRRERPDVAPGTFTETKLTPIRKVISQRLQEAKTFIPHFYVEMEIDAAPIIAVRAQLKEMGLKPTVNDYIIRACALALREHPAVNGCFNTANNTIVHYETIDIAVAVTLEDGLVTPILRHVDYKNLGEIHTEMRSLMARAKEGKLEPQEYKGGSFTISNLGMYGVKNFQAIINPPQAAILAVSGIHETPIVQNGTIVPGQRMNICLSADHRVVDGVLAAEFLVTVKRFLENPASLLL